ncbi:MAG: hypothetical protein HQ492_04810 [Woeseiaceae bacterium]|nr:hypothetical protein [Woeseiaceae bacterium]
MHASYDKKAAVVVLPPVSNGRLQDAGLKVWLAQSDLTHEPGPKELLARIIQEIGLPYPDQGFAALRMWGQTGDRPTHWIAAADPVYLEPRLDHLCLHSLQKTGLDVAQIRSLIDHLQTTLAGDKKIGFVQLGSCCYLSSSKPIATATLPACVVDQQKPDTFLPEGKNTASHRTLLSEIEMALHEHEVNLERVASGLPPINSLWLWGGGIAPDKITRPQPPLFSDDGLLRGYWHSATALTEHWPGSISKCIEQSVAGFVAETPEFDDSLELLESCLHELSAALRSGRLSNLTLLFRDGLRAHVRRSHALRVWRRNSGLLDAAVE